MDSSYRTTVDWQAAAGVRALGQTPGRRRCPSRSSRRSTRRTAIPRGFAEWFAISQTLLPALMFLPGSQAYRLPIRVGAYAISLARSCCGGSIAGAGADGAPPGRAVAGVRHGVRRADDRASADQQPAVGRRADAPVLLDSLPVVLGAGVRHDAASARARAGHAAGVQRHQLDGRRGAGVQPRPLHAAGAVVGLYGQSRRARLGDVRRARRTPPDPPSRAVRHAWRRVRRRHHRGAPRPDLLLRTDRALEARDRAGVLAGGHLRDLSQSRARQPRHGARHDGRVPGAAGAPERAEAPGHLRRLRHGDRRGGALARDRARRPVDSRARLVPVRRRAHARCTTRRAVSSSSTRSAT